MKCRSNWYIVLFIIGLIIYIINHAVTRQQLGAVVSIVKWDQIAGWFIGAGGVLAFVKIITDAIHPNRD